MYLVERGSLFVRGRHLRGAWQPLGPGCLFNIQGMLAGTRPDSEMRCGSKVAGVVLRAVPAPAFPVPRIAAETGGRVATAVDAFVAVALAGAGAAAAATATAAIRREAALVRSPSGTVVASPSAVPAWHLVVSGRVSLALSSSSAAALGPGQSFGAVPLISGTPAARVVATVVDSPGGEASSERLVVCGKGFFRILAECPDLAPALASEHWGRRLVVSAPPLLQDPAAARAAAARLTLRCLEVGQKVVDKDVAMGVVVSGAVTTGRGGALRPGQCWLADGQVVATETTDVLLLAAAAVVELTSKKKKKTSGAPPPPPPALDDGQWKRLVQPKLPQAMAKLAVDGSDAGLLGRGAYGEVRRASVGKLSAPCRYAIKSVPKTRVAKPITKRALWRERDAMVDLAKHPTPSPFVVTLYNTFEDATHFHFLLEPVSCLSSSVGVVVCSRGRRCRCRSLSPSS